jgi:hypothetical protein
MKETRARNHGAWAGPLIAVIGLVTYFAYSAKVPMLRDSAALNLLLVAAGVGIAGWALVRRRSWKSWLGLAGAVLPAALLVGYVFVLSNQMPEGEGAAAVGDPAPSLELSDHTGRMTSLADFEGRRVLVVFYRGFW